MTVGVDQIVRLKIEELRLRGRHAEMEFDDMIRRDERLIEQIQEWSASSPTV
jgi:hypothetical protein